ncbi:MAG: lipase family protein [Algibacter sp.]
MKNILVSIICFLSICVYSQNNDEVFNDEVIDDLNPQNFLLDFSKYNQKTAVYNAHLSNIVYENEDSIKSFIKALNSKYPNSRIEYNFISNTDTDTEILLFCTKKFMIISFRGTAGGKDLITDSKFFLYSNRKDTINSNRYKHIPSGHGGFRKSLSSVIEENQLFKKIDILIKKQNNKSVNTFPIYLTGHSLGAALASMFINPLKANNYNFKGCYNFAPPLAISNYEAILMKSDPSIYGVTYDIVNNSDYITRFTRYCRKNMQHIGKFHRICYDYDDKNYLVPKIQREDETFFQYKFHEQFSFSSLFDKFHRIKYYISAVKHELNSSDKVLERDISDQGHGCSCLKPKNCNMDN